MSNSTKTLQNFLAEATILTLSTIKNLLREFPITVSAPSFHKNSGSPDNKTQKCHKEKYSVSGLNATRHLFSIRLLLPFTQIPSNSVAVSSGQLQKNPN
jgi:hypothetical protein